ncbi:MAG: single-stranded DNA-binding protein [Calditrichaeota bacterium]|nr:single-stranded DNA-binding protein [Candidatus Cloacimonadota bacterium]MCA9787222.1 single-stranded DNA-binding protein [Candidatus Cloacimonadota bacterium]MCB1047928.1 single-stranded DNA-binding protein [Calditrichota bacterium]MCB9474272.1 single-stranded DNA-binding protein [Candidatus Delongbacteria bacterium]
MVNKVTLIGRLGKDPEFRMTAGGTAVAKFTLATSEKRKNANGELSEQTEWHRITCWGRQAEVARDYLNKGSLLYVEGRIHYDSYDNKEGQKVYTTDIVVNNFQMLSGRGDSGGGGGASHGSHRSEAPASSGSGGDSGSSGGGGFDDDDLPF